MPIVRGPNVVILVAQRSEKDRHGLHRLSCAASLEQIQGMQGDRRSKLRLMSIRISFKCLLSKGVFSRHGE